MIALVCENFPSLLSLRNSSHSLLSLSPPCRLLAEADKENMESGVCGFHIILVNKDISLSSHSHASSQWMCLTFLLSNTCFISAAQTLALKRSSYRFPVCYPVRSYSCISSQLLVSMCARWGGVLVYPQSCFWFLQSHYFLCDQFSQANCVAHVDSLTNINM